MNLSNILDALLVTAALFVFIAGILYFRGWREP